jgi:hypothetical protein
MTDDQVIEDAIERHPECTFGIVVPGLNAALQFTRVARLWRNEECYDAGDPCRHEVEGYPI